MSKRLLQGPRAGPGDGAHQNTTGEQKQQVETESLAITKDYHAGHQHRDRSATGTMMQTANDAHMQNVESSSQYTARVGSNADACGPGTTGCNEDGAKSCQKGWQICMPDTLRDTNR